MTKLYNLYRVCKGKKDLIMVDTLVKVQKRQKTLRNSYRGKKVEVFFEPAEPNEEKYKKPPDTQWKGYNNRGRYPRSSK